MTVSEWIAYVDQRVWGPGMLVLLMGTGVFLTLRTRFLPWRNLGWALKSVLGRDSRAKAGGAGDVSPFSALMTTLAATIGTGNIVGVATALVAGGPGALVWMEISALFGLSSKCAECLLAVKYRQRDAGGEMRGGPMYTMCAALRWKRLGGALAFLFALFTVLASLGMGEGVGGGKCAPERTITRAEFTVIAMRFARLPEGGENPFSDVTSSDWFYDQVVGAVQYGWITGYTDGTFRPEATITRAEVTAITNRLLDRAADEDYVDDHAGELRQFPDVSASCWAYHDIVEATNAHSYRVYDGEEHWM